MHEAFEREMTARHPTFDLRRERDGYADEDTDAMWAGFCLAWAASGRDELLAALEIMVANFGPTPSGEVRGLCEARAAIAKAKGGKA